MVDAANGDDFACFESGHAVDIFDSWARDEVEFGEFWVERSVDGTTFAGDIGLESVVLLDNGTRCEVDVEFVFELCPALEVVLGAIDGATVANG